jgi:hypothetical protein
MQQIGVVCQDDPQSRKMLIECFDPKGALCGSDPVACAHTWKLFEWTRAHIDDLLALMVDQRRLMVDEFGMYKTVGPAERTRCYASRAEPEPKPVVKSVLETEFLKDEGASSEADACIVCMDRKKQLASIECGHVLFCFACARVMIATHGTDIKCPICARPIASKMLKVFV